MYQYYKSEEPRFLTPMQNHQCDYLSENILNNNRLR